MVIKKSLAGAIVLAGVCALFLFPVPGFAATELVSLTSGLCFVGDVKSRDDQYIILERDKATYQIALSEIISSEPFSGTSDEIPAVETSREWAQVIEVISNYFSHRYDPDLQVAMDSVSKEFYNATMIPGVDIDYKGLERFLKKRSLEVRGFIAGSFDLSNVTIENNTLAITVSFQEVLENLINKAKNSVRQNKVVVLSHDGRGWKIINILNAQN